MQGGNRGEAEREEQTVKGIGYVLIVLGLFLALNNNTSAWWLNVLGVMGLFGGYWCMSRERGYVYKLFRR